MSPKSVKNEESAIDSDDFAKKVKAKLMPSIERIIRDVIKQEVTSLGSEAIRHGSMTECEQ